VNKILVIVFLFGSLGVQGQQPIEILESTIKISAFSEEEFYFGFAEGLATLEFSGSQHLVQHNHLTRMFFGLWLTTLSIRLFRKDILSVLIHR
jgi:hypothetical protein